MARKRTYECVHVYSTTQWWRCFCWCHLVLCLLHSHTRTHTFCLNGCLESFKSFNFKLWPVKCLLHTFFCRSKCLRVCASSVCTERHNQYTCTHNIKHTLQRLHILRHPLCWNWTGPIELYCSYVHCTIHTNLIPKCEFLSYTRWVNGWAKEMQRVNILSSKKSVSKNPQRHLLGIPPWAFSNRQIMEFWTFEIVLLNFIQNNWIWIN